MRGSSARRSAIVASFRLVVSESAPPGDSSLRDGVWCIVHVSVLCSIRVCVCVARPGSLPGCSPSLRLSWPPPRPRGRARRRLRCFIQPTSLRRAREHEARYSSREFLQCSCLSLHRHHRRRLGPPLTSAAHRACVCVRVNAFARRRLLRSSTPEKQGLADCIIMHFSAVSGRQSAVAVSRDFYGAWNIHVTGETIFNRPIASNC